MSGSLDKAQNSLQKMGSSLTSIGQKMTMGITAPLVGAGVAMFKTFADFESVMAELEARTGSTAEEMKKMSDFAIQMGRDTAFSAQQAAEALLELTSSGSSAAEAMQMLPDVLDLAAAGALELGEAADGVTDVLAQFGMESYQAISVVDSLTKAAGASSATVADLVQGFGNVGPVAAQFGMGVNETAAALATFSENGVKGAEAGTMLKSMLLGMSRDTIDTQVAWNKLGVSMYDAAGNMRAIDDVFKDINAAMEGMTMEEQNQIARDLAGSYGLVGFNALRASNGISDMELAMQNAAGASEVADARMNTLAGAFSSLMGSIETLGIVLGGLGAGPLTEFIKFLTGVINKITEWVQANPKLAQMVMVILAIVAALGPVLVILGSIISAIGAISAAFATGGILAGAAAFVVPFLAVAAAIIAVGVALKMLFPYLKQLGEIIFLSFAKLGEQIVNLWNGIIETVKQAILKLGEFAVTGVEKAKQAAQSGWEAVKNSANGTATVWGKNVAMMGEIFTTLAAKAFGWGNNVILGFVNGIKAAAAKLWEVVKGIATKVQDTIKNVLKIKSPSKVMMALGEQVTAGFNQGIESFGGIGVQVPALAGAGASVSSSPASGSSGGMGTGGNVYIENLSVPPGTTKEQIDFIMKEIGKRVKLRGGS
jgi:TP901 family phage tail tape measure protein